LEKGADINFKSEFDITPLMMSCYFNNEILVSYLVERKADLNITNMDNDSPLTIATYFNNKNIINTLVNKKAKNMKNKYDESAITIANTMNNEELKEILERSYIVDGEEVEQIYETNSDDSDDDIYICEQNYIINSEMVNRDLMNKLYEVADKSICLIKINNNKEIISGTGFFLKLSILSNEEPLYGLITNNHVLNSEHLHTIKSFKIIINKKTFEINLNDSDFIFTSEILDITFIQLIDEKYINNPIIDFLEPEIDEDKSYIGKSISIIQYPNQQQSFASGRISFLSGFNYFHSVTTDEGSSGSPLLINDINNLKVIGIHKISTVNLHNNSIKNLATKFSVVSNVINIIYSKKHIYGIKARERPRELNDYEIDELKHRGIEETNVYNVFKCPYFKSKNKIVLFYKSNHGWYCALKNKIKNKYNEKILKTYGWIFINPYESIEKIIDRIGKENLEHRHEIIIMWLKLSEFKYI